MTYTEEQLANMSDEDLMNLDPAQLASGGEENTETETKEEQEPPAEAESTAEETTAEETESETADENADEDKDQDQGTSAEGNKGNDDSSDDSKEAGKEPAKADEKAKPQASKPADAKPTDAAPATPADGDLKAFHAAITAPFKANGRDMQVTNADEAIALMQMGANYNKKMAALKPNLTLMKMLDKAGLLKEESINFLIDVASKKPEAISKLVKDAGIDPLDISVEKAGDYTPGDHRVTESEQALDEVFDSLQGTEGFDRTLDVIGKQWDNKSRGLIAQHPQALHDLTAQIRVGVFDVVMAKVERERMLNRLNGLSDLEAYRQVGEAMAKSGELAQVLGKAAPASQQAAPAKVTVESKPKQAEDDDRRKKRQAASPTRAAAPSTKLPADFNPLAMSDDEIAKLDISKFQ